MLTLNQQKVKGILDVLELRACCCHGQRVKGSAQRATQAPGLLVFRVHTLHHRYIVSSRVMNSSQRSSLLTPELFVTSLKYSCQDDGVTLFCCQTCHIFGLIIAKGRRLIKDMLIIAIN